MENSISQKHLRTGWLRKLSQVSAMGKRARVAAVLESKLKRKWKRRYFILNGRKLFYFKTEPSSDSSLQKPKGIINLNEYHSVTQDLDSFPSSPCLRLISLGRARTLVLAVQTMDELKAWIDSIRDCLPDIEESEQRALEWVEEQEERLSRSSSPDKQSAAFKLFRKRSSKGKASVSPTSSVSRSLYSLVGDDTSSDGESIDEVVVIAGEFNSTIEGDKEKPVSALSLSSKQNSTLAVPLNSGNGIPSDTSLSIITTITSAATSSKSPAIKDQSESNENGQPKMMKLRKKGSPFLAGTNSSSSLAVPSPPISISAVSPVSPSVVHARKKTSIALIMLAIIIFIVAWFEMQK